MKKLSYIFIISLLIISCEKKQDEFSLVATSAPVAMILQEITGTPVDYILPQGASPHTFSPKPSDVLKSAKATALFYVSKSLDGWAEKLDSKNKFELLRLMPKNLLVKKSNFGENAHHDEHEISVEDSEFEYDEYDSHFWTDPLAIKSLLPILVQKLSELNPGSSALYKKNADNFAVKLIKLDEDITILTSGLKNKPIFLFHPSFLYFINRYGLTFGGSIEWNPGEENSPNYMADLINSIKSANVKAIFSEPQLPNKAAMVLAEQTGTKVALLDPIGGTKNRKTYYDLLMFNVNALRKALE